jgi:hypothetical protein
MVLLRSAINIAIGGDDDERTAKEWAKAFGAELLGTMAGTMIGIREAGSAIGGFYGYQGPAGTRVFSDSSKLLKEISQGEVDKGLIKSLNSVGGVLFHYPAGFVQKTAQGVIEVKEGRGNALSLLFGKPKKD